MWLKDIVEGVWEVIQKKLDEANEATKSASTNFNAYMKSKINTWQEYWFWLKKIAEKHKGVNPDILQASMDMAFNNN
jgi:hypothetical protein